MPTPEEFLSELDAQNATALERIGVAAACEPGGGITVAALLQLALKNELEATECAAAWIPTTQDIDVKLALARQAGDEAKHFGLIRKRLAAMGAESVPFDAWPPSAMLTFLLSLRTIVERVAAGQFTREALAVVRNAEFIRFCESKGDEATAAMYRDVIQPDERHHHELGRSLLLKLAVTGEAQAAAKAAAAGTLKLAEELQEIARMKRGISRAPGC
jgi:hypothetical protein